MGSVLALLALSLAALPPSALPAAPPDVEGSLRLAGDAYRAGDYLASEASLVRLLAALDAADAPAAERPAWTRLLLQLARVEGTLGQGARSQAALERLVAVEPGLVADPDEFSPRFRRDLDRARARLAAAPHHRLRVSAPAAAGVRIDGRPLGDAPADVELPAGRYRVEAVTSSGSAVAWVDLAGDASVALAPPSPPAREAPASDRLSAAPPASARLDLSAPAPVDWMRPAALASGGVAFVAAGVATWQGVLAVQARDEANGMLLPSGALKPGIDPATYAAVARSFETARRNAWIAGGTAAALGGTAVLLWLLAPSAPVTATADGLALGF